MEAEARPAAAVRLCQEGGFLPCCNTLLWGFAEGKQLLEKKLQDWNLLAKNFARLSCLEWLLNATITAKLCFYTVYPWF